MSPPQLYPQGYGVLVIGAGSGIGRGTSRFLAARGARVIAVDRDAAAVEATADVIRADGHDALAVTADVTQPDTLRAAIADALTWNGQVHAVVNSAGVQGPLGRPSHEVEVEAFESTLRVNLTAGLVIAREVIPHMLEHGYGRIVHVASIAGKEGNPNMVAYSASKAGLIGLVKSQGKEYAGTGVTVNAVAPAVIETEFLRGQPAEVVDYMVARIPMGRVGTIDEVAAVIAFAASEDCGFTTGFTFDVSGGRATY